MEKQSVALPLVLKKVGNMKNWSLNLTRPSPKWKPMEHLIRSSRNGQVKANHQGTVPFQKPLLLLVKKRPLKNQNTVSQVILPLHHSFSRMGKISIQESIWTWSRPLPRTKDLSLKLITLDLTLRSVMSNLVMRKEWSQEWPWPMLGKKHLIFLNHIILLTLFLQSKRIARLILTMT